MIYDHVRLPGLGDVPAPPPRPADASRLGSVPRGFFEEATPGRCDDASAAFVRGLLMPRADYDALPLSAPLGTPSQTTLHLTPRWALYGGPIPTRKQAREADAYLSYWAPGQGLVWVSFPDGTPCIVASHRLPWPTNAGFGWTWVREVGSPRRVVYSQSYGKYVWE